MQLYLIRHPQPALSPSTCYGQSDLALSTEARHQLDELASTLRCKLPAGITLYSSPLQRCRLLAEKLHPQPLFDDRLLEMHFGHWEMRLWDALPREQVDAWAADPLHYRIPGGESVAQMQKRIFDFINEQKHNDVLALVAHAGTMKILAGAARGLAVPEWMSLHFDYGTLHVLSFPANLSQ